MVLTNAQLNNHPSLVNGVVTLVGLTLTLVASVAHAQPTSVVSYNPPNRGAPTISPPAGSRPWCAESNAEPVNHPVGDELRLTLMAPALTHWGATTVSMPHLWLYVPENSNTLKLVLIDEQTQTLIYETVIPAQAQGAIEYLPMPPDTPTLEPEREYRLRFDGLCDSGALAGQSSGVIEFQAISAELQFQLDTASPLEQAQLLADAGMWYDAFHTVATQYCAKPDSFPWSQAWRDLLQHHVVGLDAMINQPLLGCPVP